MILFSVKIVLFIYMPPNYDYVFVKMSQIFFNSVLASDPYALHFVPAALHTVHPETCTF